MNMLYRHFLDKHERELESLLPADPLSDSATGAPDELDEAVDSFIAVFTRISTHLGANLGTQNGAFGNALLVVQWMRGHPLHRIIDGQLKYWTKRGKPVPTVIRETMERVERVARFETPKYLHAYLDILRIALDAKGRPDLYPDNDDFWLFLEFGVSKRTQLSLMTLGLSRSSVTALSDFIKEDSLSQSSCLDWLEQNPWIEFGLPRLVEIEIETVLRRHRRLQTNG
jgi:hypothetical protein